MGRVWYQTSFYVSVSWEFIQHRNNLVFIIWTFLIYTNWLNNFLFSRKFSQILVWHFRVKRELSCLMTSQTWAEITWFNWLLKQTLLIDHITWVCLICLTIKKFEYFFWIFITFCLIIFNMEHLIRKVGKKCGFILVISCNKNIIRLLIFVSRINELKLTLCVFVFELIEQFCTNIFGNKYPSSVHFVISKILPRKLVSLVNNLAFDNTASRWLVKLLIEEVLLAT